MKANRILAAALLALASMSAAGCSRGGGDGTVEGKATIAGSPAGGADAQFFVKQGVERSGTPFRTVRAGQDGAFRAAMPPGSYYLVVRATVRDGARSRAYKGEFPGNPVRVDAGGRVEGVVVALAEMSSGGFAAQEKTGVTGAVTLAGRPLEGAYVYAYPASAKTARGPAYLAFARTGADGRFRLALREGEFLVAARRKGGDDETGAMRETGESSGEDIRRVSLSAGIMREIGSIALHQPEEGRRRERAEKGGQETFAAELRGTVTREGGAPGEGIYVMAYADRRMIGRPFAVSGKTGADGAFTLRLPRAGTFYIGARSAFGGPLSPGEWVGSWDGAADHGIAVSEGDRKAGLRIQVVEKW
jgi:hypothetical protein